MQPSLRKFDLQEIKAMDRFFRTTFMNSVSGFKSVNLCATAAADGTTNLAIFSSIVHIGANPPYIGMVFRPHTVPRHTLENLLETGFYTLNHLHAGIYQQAHQSSARYDGSEFEATGLTPVYSQGFPAPYVAESKIRIGLKYEERHDMLNGTVMVVGSVQEVFLPEATIAEDGYVDLAAAGSLTIAGLDAYHETQLLSRMAYAKPDLPPRSLE